MNEKIKKLVSYYMRICETNDPFKIAEFIGIHVLVCPLGNVDGTYRYIKRGHWIFINSDIDNESYARVVMAHELGHALLHKKENCCFMAHYTMLLTSKIEREANTFAARLLITDDLIQEFSGFTKDQFSRCTGIPEELIDLRLK